MTISLTGIVSVTLSRDDVERIVGKALGTDDNYGAFSKLHVVEVSLPEDDSMFLEVSLAPNLDELETDNGNAS